MLAIYAGRRTYNLARIRYKTLYLSGSEDLDGKLMCASNLKGADKRRGTTKEKTTYYVHKLGLQHES
jgi:hypothetical protein